MAYIQIPLSENVPSHVAKVVRKGFEPYLREVRGLLCVGTDVHFPFSAATSLLSVVAGLSTTLYGTPGTPGELFVGVIKDWFPWTKCPPPNGLSREGVANVLYNVFRNPLVHSAGLRKPSRRVVKIMTVSKTETGVTNLEKASRPIRAPLKYRPDATVLVVDGLYWAVRRMIVDMSSDHTNAQRADEWLAKYCHLRPEAQ